MSVMPCRKTAQRRNDTYYVQRADDVEFGNTPGHVKCAHSSEWISSERLQMRETQPIYTYFRCMPHECSVATLYKSTGMECFPARIWKTDTWNDGSGWFQRVCIFIKTTLPFPDQNQSRRSGVSCEECEKSC